MRKIFYLIAFLSLSISEIPAQNRPLQVAVVTGGHDFDSAAFFGMFDSFKGVQYRQLTQPGALGMIQQKDGRFPDAVVFYDMPQEISARGKEVFRMLLMGGTGLVFLHHSLASYQQWPEYKKMVGGKYHEKNSPDASKYSTYKHDVQVPVKILDPTHPVCAGIHDFSLLDEVYGSFEVLSGVIPLLGTSQPESGPVIGWTQQVANSRIVYIQPGHDKNAFSNQDYRRLVFQAIRYVSEESAY
ncbi:MAG: ThuA domain-containing protein [Bacteroidales bacterium]